MIKNIVVPLDGSNFSWSAAHHAIQIARQYRATVHGVSITDVKIIEGQLLDDLNVDSATAQSLYQDKGRGCTDFSIAAVPQYNHGVQD